MANTNYTPRNGYKPNGVLNLPLGWRGGFLTVTIIGGPYDAFEDFDRANERAYGVMVRAERSQGYKKHLHLPIHDFNVPEDNERTRLAVRQALLAAVRGQDVFVGCMGGWGRTGLFLALMAKAVGIADPVSYVRQHYTPKAVETDEQQDYVDNFDVSGIAGMVFRRAWLKRLGLA